MTPPSKDTLRALVVEDNPIHSIVVEALLRQLGVTAEVVPSGERAVEVFRGGRFDIVLMDVNLPGMDGVETARLLREHEAATGGSRTPVVAMTAHITDEEIVRYRSSGMTGYLGKPLDELKLRKAFTTWCPGYLA